MSKKIVNDELTTKNGTKILQKQNCLNQEDTSVS